MAARKATRPAQSANGIWPSTGLKFFRYRCIHRAFLTFSSGFPPAYMDIFSFVRAKHNLVFKLLLVSLVSLLLALMLPDRQVKGHKVDGFTAVWPYPDLVTDQDFFVCK